MSMKYSIKFEKSAVKFLNKLTKEQRIRIYEAIKRLPQGSDIKKLKNKNLYRLRIGKIRVIYAIDNGMYIINVINIDSRGQVYNNL